MDDQDGLFEEPTRVEVRAGDKVCLRSLIGDVACTVTYVGRDGAGWPMAIVRTPKGEQLTVSRSSLRLA